MPSKCECRTLFNETGVEVMEPNRLNDAFRCGNAGLHHGEQNG
jgi:hypothetical protein